MIRVRNDGMFSVHRDRGGVCAGSELPLHVPGLDDRTVGVFGMAHDMRTATVLVAQMSGRCDRWELDLTIGDTDSGRAVRVPLAPRQVRCLVEGLDDWAQRARSVIGPLRTHALATGRPAPTPAVAWNRVLPTLEPVYSSRTGAHLAATTAGAGSRVVLYIAAAPAPGPYGSVCTTLSVGQVRDLRDDLRLWLDWVAVLDGARMSDTISGVRS